MAITRRRLLCAAGASALLPGCPLNVAPVPPDSPLLRGRYPVGQARLGATPGTTRPPVPDTLRTPVSSIDTANCAGGTLRSVRPATIDAAVYFPAVAEGSDPGQPIAARIHFERRFPLILYAHAKRRWLTCPEAVPAALDPSLSDPTLDFTRVGHLLSHIASWGFVVVAPDLGWLTGSSETGALDNGSGDPSSIEVPRAKILVALHDALVAGAADTFGGQLNPVLLGLFGHSSGAAACIAARSRLANTRILGLVAPAADPSILAQAATNHAALVIGGTRDTDEGANPDAVYARFTGAKFLVRLGGANHLGYTELCDSPNQVCMDLDPAGAISRLVQQESAAAYLVAAARAFLDGDAGMLSYLTDYRHTGAAGYLPSLEIVHSLY